MYITLPSVKRNLGFKGLEVNDLIIGGIVVIVFLILFCCTSFKLLGLFLLIIGIFLLIPITVSQKNRMYKVMMLLFKYIFSKKEFTYLKNN